MPLYALIDGQPRRVLDDGPRRASCADCGQEMIARTGAVRIWHWAHLVRNPHCEAARETEWHLAWKVLGIDGTQEIAVGRRRADVLAPGGYAVEFQASALTAEEVHAREDDWAGQGGMAWVFKADTAFRDHWLPRIKVKRSLAAYKDDLLRPENWATLNITWSYAPERVRAARAPTFLDIGEDELLFIGAWRDERPLTGYGWRVPKDWVVDDVLRGSKIPAPLAEDPVDVERRILAYLQRQRENQQAERWRQATERGREAVKRQKEILARTQADPQHAAGLRGRDATSPAPGFVISSSLREWRLEREAQRAGQTREAQAIQASVIPADPEVRSRRLADLRARRDSRLRARTETDHD
jgi:Competence protein CoiA-like family